MRTDKFKVMNQSFSLKFKDDDVASMPPNNQGQNRYIMRTFTLPLFFLVHYNEKRFKEMCSIAIC